MTGNEKPTVVELLSRVMEDVQGIAKRDRNTQQNFNFRGIDSVVNAVGPALRKHGVVVVPVAVVAERFDEYETKSQTRMRNATLTITWRFHGPAGDSFDAQTMGEAADAGDKAVPKAHSVAYRTLLLQALCIPTDEPDPDSQSHERAAEPPEPVDPMAVMRGHIARLGADRKMSVQEIGDDFVVWSNGKIIPEANLGELTDYAAYLKRQPVPA